MFEFIYKPLVMRRVAKLIIKASESRHKPLAIIKDDPSLAILGHVIKLAYDDSIPVTKDKIGSQPSLKSGSYLILCLIMEWILAQKDTDYFDDAAFLVRYFYYPRRSMGNNNVLPSRLTEDKNYVGERNIDGEYKFTPADNYVFSVVDSYMCSLITATKES